MGRTRSSRLTVFSPAKVNELLLSSEKGPPPWEGQRGIALRGEAGRQAGEPGGPNHETGANVVLVACSFSPDKN
jgi:hypothetical protein